MNMRILDAVRKIPCTDPVKNMLFDDLRGFVCFIPSVIVGEVMIIMYSNAISVRHRSSAAKLNMKLASTQSKPKTRFTGCRIWRGIESLAKSALLPRCTWRAAFSIDRCESKPTRTDISFLTVGIEPRSTLLISRNTLSMGIYTRGMDSYQQRMLSTCSMSLTIFSIIGTSMTHSTSHTMNLYVKMPGITA